MAKSVSFIITMDLPKGATTKEAMRYVEDEVKAACGGLHPADNFFNLDRSSVRVTLAPTEGNK